MRRRAPLFRGEERKVVVSRVWAVVQVIRLTGTLLKATRRAMQSTVHVDRLDDGTSFLLKIEDLFSEYLQLTSGDSTEESVSLLDGEGLVYR